MCRLRPACPSQLVSRATPLVAQLSREWDSGLPAGILGGHGRGGPALLRPIGSRRRQALFTGPRLTLLVAWSADDLESQRRYQQDREGSAARNGASPCAPTPTDAFERCDRRQTLPRAPHCSCVVGRSDHSRVGHEEELYTIARASREWTRGLRCLPLAHVQ